MPLSAARLRSTGALIAVLVAAPAARAGDIAEDLKSVFDGGKRPAAGLFSVPPSPPAPAGSDWVPADPGGSTRDGNVSAPDKLTFWARLQDQTFDSLCRQAEIPISISQRFFQAVEPGGELHRYLRQLPTGELAIIDETMLKLGAGWLPKRSFDDGNLHAGLSLFAGAKIEGRSAVVRELATKKACAQLTTLADFRHIKTVIPVTAKRIMEMSEGEIWRLPVTFQVGVGGSAGDQVRFPLTLSLGAFRAGDVTVTLRRIDQQTLRFRLHLEQATLLDAKGKINANIPVLVLGLPAAQAALAGVLGGATGNIVGGVVNDIAWEVANAINDYLAVQLDVEMHRRDGTQHALEFVLDPRDHEQMEKLAHAIRGDLNVLGLLRRAAGNPSLRRKLDPWEAIGDIAGDETSSVGQDPSFAGEDKYKRVQKPLKARIPFIGEYQRVSGSETDHVILNDRLGGDFTVYRGETRSRRAFADIPFVGEFFSRDAQRNADVMVHRDPGGKAQGPAVVYLQQEGFLRQDGHDARTIVRRANDVIRLAGAHGSGSNARLELPIDQIFPPGSCAKPGCPPAPPGAIWRETEYRRGASALTVVLNEPAVRDVLAAKAQAVLAAYANTLCGPARLMADWLAAHASASDRGVTYDRAAAKAAASEIAEAAGVPRWRLLLGLRKSAAQLSWLVSRLAAARSAKTEEEQAHSLATMLSASGPRKLCYGDALRVLIQLADPFDISGEFFVDLLGGGLPERRARYVLHANARGDELLNGAMQAKARFRQPTTLSD